MTMMGKNTRFFGVILLDKKHLGPQGAFRRSYFSGQPCTN